MGLKPISKEQALTLLAARAKPNDIVLSLLGAFPDFTPRWKKHVEWWGGQPAGVYNDTAQFVHFVVDDLHAAGKTDAIIWNTCSAVPVRMLGT